METIEINVKISVSSIDIKEIIDMAGYGIGYWANKAIITDTHYIVTEDETNKTYNLIDKDIARGIKLYIENGNKPYNIIYENGIDTTNIDCVVADMIIQYACFGDIIYG